MVDITKLRQNVEKVLFLLVLVSTLGFIGNAVLEHNEIESLKATVEKVLLCHAELTGEGEGQVTFGMISYFDYIREFIVNIVIGSKSDIDERIKDGLYLLSMSMANYKTILEAVTADIGCSARVRLVIDRFMGKNLDSWYGDSSMWMNTELYRYISYFRPLGFENEMVKVTFGGARKTYDVPTYAKIVLLQYMQSIPLSSSSTP